MECIVWKPGAYINLMQFAVKNNQCITGKYRVLSFSLVLLNDLVIWYYGGLRDIKQGKTLENIGIFLSDSEIVLQLVRLQLGLINLST